MLIDTHCHLDDPFLLPRLDQVIAAAEKAGVMGFVIPGVLPANWENIVSLQAEGAIFAAPGVHPLHAGQWNQELATRLAMLAPEIIAIGEIGLDYSPGMPARDVQMKAFREQLRIARKAGLPVIIHCRKAFADTLRALAEERALDSGGVMHAFSGSIETARQCLSMGLKIGVAGSVTWHNAVKPVAIARDIPLDQLLLETDSPDLAPEPHRDRANEPAFLCHIAARVAELRGVPISEVAAVTSATASALFRLPSLSRP